jgi:hypothetical protein
MLSPYYRVTRSTLTICPTTGMTKAELEQLENITARLTGYNWTLQPDSRTGLALLHVRPSGARITQPIPLDRETVIPRT